jgi:hypothetical protein
VILREMLPSFSTTSLEQLITSYAFLDIDIKGEDEKHLERLS